MANFHRLFIALLMASCAGSVFADKPIPNVRIVTVDQRAACKYLGLVSVRKALGPNKQKGAFNRAFKEVQALGGNSLFLISSTLDWAEGAQLTGEALFCNALSASQLQANEPKAGEP